MDETWVGSPEVDNSLAVVDTVVVIPLLGMPPPQLPAKEKYQLQLNSQVRQTDNRVLSLSLSVPSVNQNFSSALVVISLVLNSSQQTNEHTLYKLVLKRSPTGIFSVSLLLCWSLSSFLLFFLLLHVFSLRVNWVHWSQLYIYFFINITKF